MNAKQYKKRQKVVWDSVADVYDQSFSTLAYPATMQMILEARLQPGDRVLDLASGTGADAFTASPMVGPTGRIVGIDIADRMVAVANEKTRARGIENCEFHVMDAEELDFKSGTFDAAVSKWGLMYFPDCHRALKETLRVLKPGGRFSALVLGRQESAKFLTIGAMAAFKVNPALVGADEGPTAFQFGADGAIEALLNAAGFVNVRSHRFALMISCASGEKYWDLLLNGSGNLADKLRKGGPGVYEMVRRAAIESAEKYNSPDGIRLPFEVVLAYAEKEAGRKQAVEVPARIKSASELVDDSLRAIAPQELATKLRDDQVAIVDVRSRAEFARSRIPRAVGIQRSQLEEDAGGVLVPEVLRQIVVYGTNDLRSRLAARTLIEMGYQNVVCLDGGFDGWVAGQLAIDDSPARVSQRMGRVTYNPHAGKEVM